jgi:hypothetical protein
MVAYTIAKKSFLLVTRIKPYTEVFAQKLSGGGPS